MRTLMLYPKDIGKGNLILVNKAHPIRYVPEDDTLVLAHNDFPQIFIKKQAAKMLSEVFTVLKCSNQIVPVSGYRTLHDQKTIYGESMRDNGEEFTLKYVAAPNCSEHQSGLAIDLAENKPDIDFIRPDFPYTGICQTFREKSVAFGFIERYQKGQESITQIGHEPWHFRYVGYPHSELMQKEGLTLEKYIDFIKGFPYNGVHLKLKIKAYRIEIFYVEVPSALPVAIEIPAHTKHQVSGNNEDGFIVTLWGDTL